MMIIPSVDLMDGRVVRLTRGDPLSQTTYEGLGDPVSVAKLWEQQGAEYVHVIDLDAALGCGIIEPSSGRSCRNWMSPSKWGEG